MPFLGKVPSQIVDSDVDIDGGTIDGATIGSITAGAGTFTNLSATGTITFPDDGISGDDINGGTLSNVAISGTTASFSGDLTVDTNTLFVDSTNNRVGINTDSPSVDFQINSGSDVTASLIATTNGDATLNLLESGLGDVGASFVYDGGDNKLYIKTGNNPPATRMTIDRDFGNVGIGVTSPTSGKLCVDGTINITDTAGSYAAGALGYTDSNWGFLHRPPRVGAIGAHAFQSFAGSTLMTVTNGGNVGINVQDPDAPLEIYSGVVDDEVLNVRGFNADRGLNVRVLNASGITDKVVEFNNELSNGTFSFAFDKTRKLGFDANTMNWGQGNSAPTLTLDAAASSAATLTYAQAGVTRYIQQMFSSGNGFYWGAYDSAASNFKNAGQYTYGTAGTNDSTWTFRAGTFTVKNGLDTATHLQINSSGDVGINTTNPAYKLSVHENAVGTTYPLKIENSNTTSGNGVALLFTHLAHTGDNQGSIEYVGDGANNTNSMVFKTEANGVNGMEERLRIDSKGVIKPPSTSTGFVANQYSLAAGNSFTVTLPSVYGVYELAIFAARNDAGQYGSRHQVYHVGGLSGFPYTVWAPVVNLVSDIQRPQTSSPPTVSVSTGVNGSITITLGGTGATYSGYGLRLLTTGQAY